MSRTERDDGYVIKIVNYMKTPPLKFRRFAEMCEEVGTHYQSLLFYFKSRGLSRARGSCLQLTRSSAVFRVGTFSQ
jgi:hypothetical protein